MLNANARYIHHRSEFITRLRGTKNLACVWKCLEIMGFRCTNAADLTIYHNHVHILMTAMATTTKTTTTSQATRKKIYIIEIATIIMISFIKCRWMLVLIWFIDWLTICWILMWRIHRPAFALNIEQLLAPPRKWNNYDDKSGKIFHSVQNNNSKTTARSLQATWNNPIFTGGWIMNWKKC